MATARNDLYITTSGENIYAGITPNIAHVYIESGQSNNQGRGALADSPIADNVLVGDVKTWRRNINGGEMYTGTGAWYGLEYDTNQYESRNEFGSVLKFAMHLRDNLEDSNNHIFIIKADGNGKPIEGWLDGGNENIAMYDGHIDPALADLQASGLYDEIRIHGFFFDQGESDSGTTLRADAYQGRLETVISDLRTHLNMPNLPIILRRMEGAYTYVSTTRAAQETIASNDDNVSVINGPWTYMDANIHLDGVSQNSVGDDRYTLITSMSDGGYRYA